jgi:hypothetical protein
MPIAPDAIEFFNRRRSRHSRAVLPAEPHGRRCARALRIAFSIGFFRRHRNQFRWQKFMSGWGDD